ncbi:MAG: hypothetical protein M0R80_14450 [Proteobacteria bacterium]|nr:hypothetical protein [Pseudomonadota bacterium]
MRRVLLIAVALLVAAASWHGCQRKLELGFDPDDGGPPDAAPDAGGDGGAPDEPDAGGDAATPGEDDAGPD